MNDQSMTHLLCAQLEEKLLVDSNERCADDHHKNKHTKEHMYFKVCCTKTIWQLGEKEAHKTKKKLERKAKKV